MTTRRFTLVDGLDTADPVSAVADPGTGLVFLPTALQNLGLNYFDGRFLRADDLNFERTAQRRYADVGRQPGGFGIGYGLMLKASDTRFTLGSGVAIDKDGRLISLDDQGAREFSELVSSGKTTGAAGVSPAPSGVYIVRIARSAQLAGNAEILGRVCDTCVSPQDKPTAVDGVRVWAEPMPPVDRPTLSNVTDPVLHARSQIASGFFAYEKDRLATPMSASSLSLPVWCGGETPSANSNASEGIAVGVVAWDGSSVSWYDDWTVRREYKESRPERYWAGLLEQRPWSLFMAQVLQFQCQLAEAPRPAATTDLLAAGFVEISPAGFLQVKPATALELRHNLEALFGAGIDLRVCAVRRDQIAHEFERAQHMDRISLLRGLSNPSDRQAVDVLVPDGVLETSTEGLTSHGFAVDLAIGATPVRLAGALAIHAAADPGRLLMQGVARFDHERGVTLRSAVAGTDPGTVRAVASQLADVMRRRVTLGSVIEALGALQLDTSAPSLDVLRTIGRATVESAADHRATGGRSRFANVDAAVGRTVAISASVWMAADPFTIGAATVPFHATWDMVMPQATTLGVSVVVDGALRQISGAGADGQSIRVEVTGLVTVKGSGVPGNASSESIDPPRQLTLTRSDVGGQSSLAILDEESQVSLGVQWEGPPIEATGGLGQPRASRSARAVAEATKAIRDTLIGRIPPTPPVSSRILATFQAAEDATINQPGNAYRDASIAAVQLLSGLHPDDATFVEDRYAELFPDAGDSGRSLIRPIFDWVLFRRRRREEYEGTSVTTVAGVATVAAWVVRASGEDAATDYRDALMGGKGGVPWSETPVELVQFDMGTATMRSSAEHWRERYRAANGADTILFAGYAKSPLSTEAPVGISRSQALVAATEPLATLSADGRCDLVTRPPAGQMMDDSEGSVFLITYPTDVIEIIAANGVDPKLQDLVSALDAGDADAVAAAPAGATQPLGESAAADSPTQAELAELLDKVNDLRAQWKTGDVETTYRAVVWTQTGLSKARKDSLSTRVDLLIARLNLTTADTTRAEVQFTPDASEVVRLYLVVMPLHLN